LLNQAVIKFACDFRFLKERKSISYNNYVIITNVINSVSKSHAAFVKMENCSFYFSCVHVLSVCSDRFNFLNGTEVQEVGRAVDFMVEFFWVGQL